jgi:hypothetical protein
MPSIPVRSSRMRKRLEYCCSSDSFLGFEVDEGRSLERMLDEKVELEEEEEVKGVITGRG